MGSQVTSPKLHHYVPQFYLRRFANDKDQIGVYQRASGKTFVAPVSQTGAESGFYNILTEDGEVSTVIETEVLSRVDSDGAAAIEEVLTGPFPPSDECRSILAAYAGFQFARGRMFREIYRVQSDFMMKALAQQMTREHIREGLRDTAGAEPTPEDIDQIEKILREPNSYTVAPHNNETIKVMMRMAEDSYPFFFKRRWVLVETPKSLITTDEPVVMWVNEKMKNSFFGVGLMTADELRFPLDANHMLVMLQPDADITEDTVVLPDGARHLNPYHASTCYEYIYYHPDHRDSLDEVLEIVPLSTQRPITHISSGFKDIAQGDTYALPVKPPRVKKVEWSEHCLQLDRRVFEIPRRHDCVTTIDGFGSMSDHFHRSDPGDARPL